MSNRSSAGIIAAVLGCTLATVTSLVTSLGAARAGEDAKYPTDWAGQWTHAVDHTLEIQGTFDQTKPWGPGQQAPLTPEYQKVLADSMADQAAGGLGNYPTAHCLPSGMPRIMTFATQEYVITPETTYILFSSSDHLRRIFTDGRDWPAHPVPSYAGYSIGRWIDTKGDGVYDTLEAETRYFRGPRAFDASGLPLAFDNQSVFFERFFLDRTKPNVLHDLTTVIDHALTRPWTSDRRYDRVAKTVVQWPENWCQEGNANVVIGKENYVLRADGMLMPAKRNQTPPDLKYFSQSQR